jgi:folate-binding protein YgfZ
MNAPWADKTAGVDLALYQQLRSGGAGIYRSLERALWKLSGPDRVRYLNGQVTNDVKKLQLGHALYAGVCTGKGKLVGDIWIGAGADALWIDADISLRESLGQRLERYLISDDAALEDVTGQWTLVHLFGTKQTISDDSAAMTFKSQRFGLPGIDMWMQTMPFPVQAVPDVPLALIEALRLEHGIAQWGREMDENSLASETLREHRAISFSKGCYVGQEVISRLESVGHVNKELCVLAIEGDALPALGAELMSADGSARAGKITSVAFSPLLGKPIALGIVGRAHTPVGNVLTAGGVRATVIEPPLKIVP